MSFIHTKRGNVTNPATINYIYIYFSTNIWELNIINYRVYSVCLFTTFKKRIFSATFILSNNKVIFVRQNLLLIKQWDNNSVILGDSYFF